MKGFEIKRENEKPTYLFNRYDVVSAIAHAIYYTANPETEHTKRRLEKKLRYKTLLRCGSAFFFLLGF